MIKHSLIILFAFFAFSLQAFAQESDINSSDTQNMFLYKEGRNAYDAGDFERALRLLEEASRSNDEELAANAFFYMAECHIELGDIKSADIDAQHLMLKDPYYTVAETEYPVLATLLGRMRKKSATIVTASQQAESIDESPVPVTLITREMIEASSANNLQELLIQYVPGMSKIEGVEPNIAMRGTYSHTQENILIMLDGHRLNSYSTNVEAPDYRTSLDKIDHIEVLRGPASSLYGNVALTGVVNIITRRGNEFNGNHISAQYGSNNTIGVNLLRGKGGFRNEYLAWASIYSSKGEKVAYNDSIFPENISRINAYCQSPSYDIGTRIRWDDITLSGSIQHSKRVPYENLLQFGTYTYENYDYDHSTKPGTSRMTINIASDYNHSWNNFTLSTSLHCNYERSTLYNVIADSLQTGIPELLIKLCNLEKYIEPKNCGLWQTLSWQGYSLAANVSGAYTYSIGKQKGSVLSGIQYDYYLMPSGNFTIGYLNQGKPAIQFTTNSAIHTGFENTISAFVQLKHCFSDKIIFNGGLRYDNKRRYDSEHVSMLSPRASLIWHLTDRSTIRASYARSFVDAPFIYRAANLNLFRGDLMPQKMTSYQLGVTTYLQEANLKMELNGFYNKCIDLVIISASLGESGEVDNAFSNAGKANIGGLEHIITYQKPSTLATLNLTYQHAFKYEESNSIAYDFIPNIPEFIANLTFAQKVLNMKRWGGLWFNTNMHMQSKVHNNRFGMFMKTLIKALHNAIGDDWDEFSHDTQAFKCIVNSGIEWKFRKLKLGLNLYNIFNTHYEVSSRTNIPQPQQSRHILAKASFDF